MHVVLFAVYLKVIRGALSAQGMYMQQIVGRYFIWRTIKPKHVALIAIVAVLCGLLVTHFTYAAGEAITGSSAVTTQVRTAHPINDLVITGTGNDVVPVKLLVSSGTLAMSTTTGLTFTGSSTGSVLYFSGTRSDVNAALATLTYTRNTTGTDTLEISLVSPGEVFMPGNGHLYEYVASTLTWNGAKTAAEARTKYGATGYLTTITSQAENDFVAARLSNAGWMGASDISSEGVWRWVTGPENGTQFWQGLGNGNTVGGNYANWNPGEPNDSGGNEDCGQFLAGGNGMWNDLPCTGTTLPGYVVEYGSGASLPTVAAKNVSITTTDTVAPTTPGTPSTTSPTTNLRPVWSWSAATDAGVGLANPAYSVQWSQSATFSSGVSSSTTNSTSFTQPSNLANGTWYFRVLASDTAGNASSYSANGTVVIDTTGPTAPDLGATTIVTRYNDPTIAWNSSSDAGVGLANPAYTVQRSQSATFSSGVSSGTTNSNFYTTPALTDGVWYLRVRAADTLGNVSAWSPTVTFVIDTVTPTAPGTPTTTSPTNNQRPTWTWTAATDTGSGLNNPAYTVQWSQSATFSSWVSSATTNSTSYTHTTNLAQGTWYVRIIASDDAGNDSAASSVASVVIDSSPATLSAISATSVDSTTQTITWTSNKLASTLVQYGPTTAYDSTTPESNTSPRVTSHAATLTNLVPCTLYHYRVQSTDAVGNVAQSNDNTFITAGCAGAAEVISVADTVITTAGGTLSLNTGSGVLQLAVPANFNTQPANFQIKQINTSVALASIGNPSGKTPVGDAYDIKALEDTLTAVSSFTEPVSVTIPYTQAQIIGLVENTLRIYRWNNNIGWQALSDCVVNTTTRTVSCTTPGFSTFVLFGSPVPTVATTTPPQQSSVAKLAALSTIPRTAIPAEQEVTTAEPLTTSASDRSAFATGASTEPTETTTQPDTEASSSKKPWLLVGALAALVFFWIIFVARRRKKHEDR